MKNVTSLIVIIVLSIGIFACKKKDKNAEPDPAPSPAPVAEGTRALFNSSKTALCTGSVVYAYINSNEAYLSNQNLSFDWIALYNSKIDIGSVSMNGVTFKKNHYGQTNQYGDSTSMPATPVPQIWQVTGSSNISAFTFTNNNGYPSYNGFTAIADSFQISAGITIPLNNYSGADAIYISIDNPGGVTGSASKMLDGTATSAVFTASELSSVGTSTNAYVVITFGKNNLQNVGGKKCNFRTTYTFQKSNVKLK